MTNIIEDYKRLLEDNAAEGLLIMDGKREDYAKTTDPFSNFRRAAAVANITPEQGIIFMTAIKLVRLENLLSSGAAPNNEPAHDSAVDGMNYLNILDGFVQLRDRLPGIEVTPGQPAHERQSQSESRYDADESDGDMWENETVSVNTTPAPEPPDPSVIDKWRDLWSSLRSQKV